MVIYMDQYRRPAAPLIGAAKAGACGAGFTNRKSLSSVFYLFEDVAQRMISPELPYDLTNVDMDNYLGRVYALATQI